MIFSSTWSPLSPGDINSNTPSSSASSTNETPVSSPVYDNLYINHNDSNPHANHPLNQVHSNFNYHNYNRTNHLTANPFVGSESEINHEDYSAPINEEYDVEEYNVVIIVWSYISLWKKDLTKTLEIFNNFPKITTQLGIVSPLSVTSPSSATSSSSSFSTPLSSSFSEKGKNFSSYCSKKWNSAENLSEMNFNPNFSFAKEKEREEEKESKTTEFFENGNYFSSKRLRKGVIKIKEWIDLDISENFAYLQKKYVENEKNLNNVDCFILSSDYAKNMKEISSFLKKMLEKGKGIIVCSACTRNNSQGLNGEIMSEMPFEKGDQVDHSEHLTLIPNIPSHFLLSNVSNFDGGGWSIHDRIKFLPKNGNSSSSASSLNHNPEIEDENSFKNELVASWSDKIPLIICRKSTRSSGGIVILNFWPISNEININYWDATSDGRQIIRNSVFYSTRKGENSIARETLRIKVEENFQENLKKIAKFSDVEFSFL